ncbi:MAG: hypothetical protein IPL96_06610 [Holophagaceae bacterium]|nr:hypothetical protein [Holophagaceae bacterium]
MKARLAQHTVDCSGDAEAAREAWRAQGVAWLCRPDTGWKLVAPMAGEPSWTWVYERWGARLFLLHLVEPGPHGARIHARADLNGPLAWLHRLLLQADFRARLPVALRAVARGLAAA